MKKFISIPVLCAVGGAVVGAVCTLVSLCITSKVIENQEEKERDESEENVENTIEKVKNLLTGTEYEEMIDKYVEIISNAQNEFSADDNVVMMQINQILNSELDTQTKFENLEQYVAGLEIIHDSTLPNETDVPEEVVDESIVEESSESEVVSETEN